MADGLAHLDAGLVFAPDVSTVFNAMDERTCVIVAPNNFQFLTYPQNFTRDGLIRRKWLYRRAMDRADLVLVGSKHTFDDLAKHYPEAKSKAVLWHSPAPMDLRLPTEAERQMASRLLRAVPDPGATVLYPAQFWPHKNHRTLIRSLAILRRDYGEQASLVLTGTGQAQQPAAALARKEGIGEHVLFVGHVERGVLFALMADAAIVACPRSSSRRSTRWSRQAGSRSPSLAWRSCRCKASWPVIPTPWSILSTRRRGQNVCIWR